MTKRVIPLRKFIKPSFESLIEKKRDGGEFNQDEIRYIIDSTLDGEMPKHQLSAVLMAIYFANLRNTSRYYEQEFWRSWIACLNVGAVTLILATLTSRAARTRDAIISLSAGALMTLLVLLVTADPTRTRLTSYFAYNSATLAKGRNIVNVILVDFRGLDTLGEITVLAIAAAGVFALLKLGPPRQETAPSAPLAEAEAQPSPEEPAPVSPSAMDTTTD